MAQSERRWLDQARAAVMRGDRAAAESMLGAALSEHPRSFELRRVLAGVHQQTGRDELAASLLRDLLNERPHDAGTAFALVRLLVARACNAAAGQVMRACFADSRHDAELAIRAIELLDDVDRKADAAAIAEDAILLAPDDPRLHAYAGMLKLQLGDFDSARQHYLFALEHSPDAVEWHAPLGLAGAQRYHDARHPDFALFRECLQRRDLSDKARSSLLFALGKAHDDIGDYADAARCYREGNALAHALTGWSRESWCRTVEGRLAVPPIVSRLPAQDDFIPTLIVGMPRSGTTLIAEWLARYPRVCNRGELPWIARLAQQLDSAGTPDQTTLQRAAAVYAAQVRQDDARDSRWFIDKQPLNLRYLDYVLAMFPHARIIHCRRGPRDTALSLWTQSFNEDVQGYACDFDDIALVMHDCDRLMANWLERWPDSIYVVDYERMVTDPQATIAGLSAWMGLPVSDVPVAGQSSASIATASLWQARQPVHANSVGRWRNYAGDIPELMRFAECT